jgi:hypothetical protein
MVCCLGRTIGTDRNILSLSLYGAKANMMRRAIAQMDSLPEDGRPKHLESLRLQDLRMQGFLQTCSPHELIGFEPAFYDVYSVDERDAKRMARTLKLINDRIRKDCAHNAVDCFVALCSALRLSFVVECRDENQRSSYDDNKWYWMSIAEGRNRYRHMIEQLVKQRAA